MSSASPIVILTGASRGLGLAILRLLLSKHNARVAAFSRSSPPELEATLAEFGSDRVMLFRGDVAKVEDNKRCVDETVQKWGGIDSVVFNAGQLEPLAKFGDVDLDVAPQLMETNVMSLLYLLKPALPHLRRSSPSAGTSRVVFVSSGASTGAYQGWGMYCVAKAAMNSLCRTLAVEEKDSGVACWAVRPGVVDTSMQDLIRTRGKGVMSESDITKFQGLFDRGELLAPEQPGAVIAALAVSGPAERTGEYIDWADKALQSSLGL